MAETSDGLAKFNGGTIGDASGGPSAGLPNGEEVAKRFVLLLEKFPRGDGEPWRPVEIEEATGHQVSGSYVVALKKGKFKRPGLKQLSLIADVVGFPFELWRTEPEFWDEELKKHKVRGGLRGPAQVPGGARTPLRRVPAGEDLGRLVDDLFRNKKNPATDEPYTEEGVAARSRGRLTAEEIRLMRRGEQEEPPPELKLVALSDIFDVPTSYWFSAGGEPLAHDLDSLMELMQAHKDGQALIRHRQQDLSPGEINMLELFFSALENSRKDRGEDR